MYGALPHLIQDLLCPLTKGGDFFQALRQVLFVYRAHVEVEKPPVSLWMVLGQLTKSPNAPDVFVPVIAPDLIKRPLHRVQSLLPFLGLLKFGPSQAIK